MQADQPTNQQKEFNSRRSNYVYGASNVFLFLISTFLLAAVLYFVFISIHLGQIYFGFKAGKNSVESSVVYLKEGNLSQAREEMKAAHSSFSKTSLGLDRISKYYILKDFSFFKNNINDFLRLSKTAETLSLSADNFFSLSLEISDDLLRGDYIGFLKVDSHNKETLIHSLSENIPELNGIKAEIDLSLVYIKKVKNNYFLKKYFSQFLGVENQLSDLSDLLSNLIFATNFISKTGAYSDSAHYLVLLQNNNELRATGGFIGSYGLLELRSGDIANIDTHDIYHLDMPASLNQNFKITPPVPIKKYLGVDQWFLRDANWSPDFPTAAQKIKWFYEQEMIASGRSEEIKELSGIIAITPRLITDLLYLTGPITIDGQIYDKDNFIDILQYEVEMAFREDGISEWDRKKLIGEIVKEMKPILMDIATNRWAELLDVFRKNIERKNILVYLTDDYTQGLTQDLGWSGEVKFSDSDFLMVIDSNLAAFKTDRVMDKRIEYYLNESSGKLSSRVNIVYKNNGWFDWQTTRYRSYTRIYTPLNIKYQQASGVSQGDVYVAPDQEIKNPKTILGAFVSIEPSHSSTLSFSYELSDEIRDKIVRDKYYSLQVQKQPGNTSVFVAEFNFEKKISQYEGEGDVLVDGNKLTWSHDLDKDYELKIYFE